MPKEIGVILMNRIRIIAVLAVSISLLGIFLLLYEMYRVAKEYARSSQLDRENQLLAVRDADNAGMCLKIPFTMSRDLNDLSVENHQGHEYLRFGRSLFKPLDAVEQIVPGAHHQFTVPANGHATCFRVADPLHVELNGAQAAFVHEADLGPVFPVQFRTGVSGTLVSSPLSVAESTPVAARLQVPRGGLLMVYGEPGAACSVKAVL